jgi:putative ABC transport system permease protein
VRFRELLATVAWALLAFPARSCALLLSLGIGVAATVFVSSVISGFGGEIDRLAFGSYGSALVVRENLLAVDRYGPPERADADLLLKELADVTGVATWSFGRSLVWFDGENMSAEVFGVDGQFQDELDTPVDRGRMLNAQEAIRGSRVCLIGSELAASISGLGVGKSLTINGVNCEIVGVLGEPRSRPAERYVNSVVAPIGAVERYFAPRTDRQRGATDWITLLFPAGADMSDAEMRVDRLLRRSHGVSLSKASPFSYGNPNASLRQQREQQNLLARLLAIVAGLSVVASLVGFAAISASALTSRQREFALRLTLGATGDDIRAQVIVEAVVTGIVASIGGLGLGFLLTYSASVLWNWPFVPDFITAAIAVTLGLSVGLITGLISAKRISALSPSIAAR